MAIENFERMTLSRYREVFGDLPISEARVNGVGVILCREVVDSKHGGNDGMKRGGKKGGSKKRKKKKKNVGGRSMLDSGCGFVTDFCSWR